jgi:hypothetical protein
MNIWNQIFYHVLGQKQVALKTMFDKKKYGC